MFTKVRVVSPERDGASSLPLPSRPDPLMTCGHCGGRGTLSQILLGKCCAQTDDQATD